MVQSCVYSMSQSNRPSGLAPVPEGCINLSKQCRLHFIWVFTVCQSTHLEVSSMQWVLISTNNVKYVFDYLYGKSCGS